MNKLLYTSITNRLKEKGFTFDLPITYDGNGIYYHSIAPRISQVLDWLREEKNIDIVIYPIDVKADFMDSKTSKRYILAVYNCSKMDYKIYSNKIVTWEDAAVVGIEYVLDNLI